MSVQQFIDVTGTKFAEAVCLVDATGVPYVAGGSTPGTGLSDIVCTDNTATTFLARDNGTAITYVTFAGAAYTPTGPVKSSNASAANQVINQTSTTAIAASVANIPAKGMNTMANSTPMVMASDSPAMPMLINDGVNTAAVIKGINGSSATQNALLTTGARYSSNYTFNSSNSATLLDCGNYAWVSISFLTNGTPISVNLSTSNDGTLYTPLYLGTDNGISQTSVFGSSTGVNYDGAIRGRYLQITSTGYTGTQGCYVAIQLFTQARTGTNILSATAANQVSAQTSLSTIAGNTNNIPVKGAAVTASSMPVTIASDQTLAVLVNNSVAAPVNVTQTKGNAVMSGSIPVTLASDQPAIPIYIGNYLFKHINLNVTSGILVKNSSGALHTFTINNPGANCQAVIYDGTSTSGIIIGYVNLSLQLATLIFDCVFATGLFIQFNISSGTAFSSFTVSYK